MKRLPPRANGERQDSDHDRGVLLMIALVCAPILAVSGIVAWFA